MATWAAIAASEGGHAAASAAIDPRGASLPQQWGIRGGDGWFDVLNPEYEWTNPENETQFIPLLPDRAAVAREQHEARWTALRSHPLNALGALSIPSLRDQPRDPNEPSMLQVQVAADAVLRSRINAWTSELGRNASVPEIAEGLGVEEVDVDRVTSNAHSSSAHSE